MAGSDYSATIASNWRVGGHIADSIKRTDGGDGGVTIGFGPHLTICWPMQAAAVAAN